jgi:cytochrome bd-type quinol oxidase subunit 2
MRIPARRVFWVLLAVSFVLVLMHFSGMDHFDLDQEANFPTWYSSSLLLAVSFVSLGIYAIRRGTHTSSKFWLVFSAVYCFLSVDEAAVVHEALQTPRLPWMLFYAPLAAAFFAYCAYALVRGENRTLRNWILGGLLVYALGGLVSQAISYSHLLPPAVQHFEPVVEEFLEMTGSILVLTGCLEELERVWNATFAV